ncbi:MAG: tetratricopeptide repeat protein [Sandaracinaceae bacterium]|nr:tetratricopeptide repeat protein [Sandaracinaceae bacterium]
MRRLGWFLLIVLAASPSSSLAQAEGDSHTEQARALFEAGRVAFDAREYERALRYFTEAYELSRRPRLQYNIGVTAERLGRLEEALAAYERYLREEEPDGPQRGEAEERAAALGPEVARLRAAGDTSAGAATSSARGGGDDLLPTIGWGAVAGGGALLLTGIVFLAIGQAEAGRFEGAAEGTPWTDVASARDNADWMRVTGWVFAGLGLAAAGAGLVLALVLPSGRGESVALRAGPGGLTLAWRHR